jgi:hypothetical protein
MFNINIAVSLSSHDCSYCSSSRGVVILRAGRKAWSRSPPPTSTNPTPISTTGASTVRRARRSVLRHGQLNSPTQLSFREDLSRKKAFFSRTIKKEQAKPYTLNPASTNLWSGECGLRPIEVFTFLCAGAIAFCGEARDWSKSNTRRAATGYRTTGRWERFSTLNAMYYQRGCRSKQTAAHRAQQAKRLMVYEERRECQIERESDARLDQASNQEEMSFETNMKLFFPRED